MFISDFLRLVYQAEHALTLSAASVLQIEMTVCRFSEYLGRHGTLQDLTKVTVLEFLAARRKKVAPATVNKDRRCLLCLWRCAAENDLIAWPKKIPQCREPKLIPHTLTFNELQRLVRAAQQMPNPLWWRSLLLFLYDSGSRITAALSVRICDIDFQNRVAVLRAETSKTQTAQMVCLADDTLAAIAANSLSRDATELVWPWRYQHRRLFMHFHNLARFAGITLPRGKCFHSLRRTTATLIATDPMLGMSIASQQLGHSSEQVTRRYVGDQVGLTLLRICDRLPRP